MAEQRSNRSLVTRLFLGSVLMFGFGFLLVPLYDVFCEVTGLNGKVLNRGELQQSLTVDPQRKVRVQFLAVKNEAMPWRFKPQQLQLTVHPGEMKQTAYIAYNRTSEGMVGQAVPSVAPSEAAEYLHKVNCFCFEQQPLAAGEEQAMPLLFVVDPELPSHITTITLSYTLFDITPEASSLADTAALPARSPL